MDIGELKSKLELDIEQLCIATLSANEDLLISSQKEQMLRGKNYQGDAIGYYRNKYYEATKNRMNPDAQYRVDLKYTGAFHNSITALAGSEIIFDAKDNKTLDLVEQYSENIFGLNAETIEIDKNEYEKILVEEFKAQTGL